MRWIFVCAALSSTVLMGADSCVSMPEEFCPVEEPIPAPAVPGALGGGLDGFDSPYIGHTGSWDGKGGALGGSSKGPDMDLEVSMGLRWTFMPVYWRAMEPDGPVDLNATVPPEWQELDTFVLEAQTRNLNILMQAPVVGGNAGAPPDWAGVREEGKSAPANMEAAAEFAGKLAERYRPGGTLARAQGWGNTYGVRAWELDNEPDAYKTHWGDQAGDYAEFVTKVTARIKTLDPEAVILTPAVGGGDENPWVGEALDAYGMHGSPVYQANGIPYSIGPSSGVVSFHVYEGMDNQSVDCAFMNIRTTFESWETVPGFEYEQKLEYWHTEGNYDFFGLTPEDIRANWRWQFMTRAFAAGVRKVTVMDVSEAEKVAMEVFVTELPNPFPMRKVELENVEGQAWAYEHLDGDLPAEGQVWVLWAENGSTGALVRVPVAHREVWVREVDGSSRLVEASGGSILVELAGDDEISPPVLVLDRSDPAGRSDPPLTLKQGPRERYLLRSDPAGRSDPPLTLKQGPRERYLLRS